MQERRNYANEEDFWNAHMRRAKKTGNMERMSQTELLKVIRKRRKSINARDAMMAKELFPNEEFIRNFSYKKTGKQYVLTKPSDIAKQYRKLTGKPQH